MNLIALMYPITNAEGEIIGYDIDNHILESNFDTIMDKCDRYLKEYKFIDKETYTRILANEHTERSILQHT